MSIAHEDRWSTDELQSEDSQASLRDGVLGMVWRRKWLIVLAAVVGIMFGYIKYARTPAVYSSKCQLLVRQKAQQPLTSQPLTVQSYYQQMTVGSYLPDHAVVIASPAVIEQAIREHNLQDLHFASGSGDLVKAIKNRLTVSSLKDGSSVIELQFNCPDPTDCATVLNALMDTFQTFVGEAQENVGKKTVALITEARTVLSDQLRVKEAKYAAFRELAPLVFRQGEAVNLHQERLMQVEHARATLQLENAQLEARIRAIGSLANTEDGVQVASYLVHRELGERGQPGPADSEQIESFGSDANLVSLLISEKTLSEKYGSNHPRLKSIRRQIEIIREMTQDTASPAVVSNEDKNEQQVARFLVTLRRLRDANLEEQKNLDALFETEQQKSREIATDQVKDSSFRKDIERTQALFDNVMERLDEISIVSDYGGYNIQTLAMAEPGWKVAPDFRRTVTFYTFLGCLIGMGLGYVLDITDNTFHSAAEVSKHLRLPIVGHVPELPTNAHVDSELAPILWTHHAPRSVQSEAFRGVRTALFFNAGADKHQVIQVTSPSKGDGKSTLSANLSIAIAQSGKRVLLVDADMRKPTLHTIFAASRDYGLSSLVNGTADPPEAVQETAIANLRLLTCGPRPDNPSELLTSPRFAELVATFRDQYDFVIIDTPPMFSVSDPRAVAPRVDGVVLAIRIRKNARTNATQACHRLAELGANVIGIVVNGVGGRRSSGYGYGYEAGYGYGREGYEYGLTDGNGKQPLSKKHAASSA